MLNYDIDLLFIFTFLKSKTSIIPEGSETHFTSDILREHLLGLTITQIEYTAREGKNMSYLDSDFLGSQLPLIVTDISARGKRIIFVLCNEKGESSALVWFFAMTGNLRFKVTKYNQMSLTFCRKRDDGSFEECKELHYSDIRTLGFVKYAVTEDEIRDIFKNIGPDFLLGEVSLPYFKQVLRNKRIRNKWIGALLLEQDKVSGIGMYIMNESLFRARISPYRILNELSDSDIEVLYESIMAVMIESYKAHGLTIGDFYDPFGNPGQYITDVYGHKHDQEGNPVTHEKYGPVPRGTDNRRSIWWVPAVQI
jgi:DNA-formamidopyrimidine glycosylase